MKRFILFFFAAVSLSSMQSQSQGGITSGASAFCDTVNSGFISLSSFSGSILYWQSSSDGSNWSQINNNTATQSYIDLKRSTSFRAIVKNGSFLPDTSSVSTVTVHLPGQGGTLPPGGKYCGSAAGGTLSLRSTTAMVQFWQYSENEGLSWINLQSTMNVLTYPALYASRWFRAIVKSVPACPEDTSTISRFTIVDPGLPGIIAGKPSACKSDSSYKLSLQDYSGKITWWMTSEDGLSWKKFGDTASGQLIRNPGKTMLYTAAVSKNGCPDTLTAAYTVSVFPNPSVDAGPDLRITRYDPLSLHVSHDGHSVSWQPTSVISDPASNSTSASPMHTTWFHVSVSNSQGCSSSDSLLVEVMVPIPEAISPNGDGVNDFLVIDKIQEMSQNSLVIYNRWGSLVYEKAPYENQWNGKNMAGSDLPDGTYFIVFNPGPGKEVFTSNLLIKR